MDFTDVVKRRRMVRRYLDQPVAPEVVARALTNATRAPSAGFTQGWSFLVLRTQADIGSFWEATTPTQDEPAGTAATPNRWLDGMRTAPVVIVVLASESAYRSRYSEADKHSAQRRAAEMPWWQIDAAMSALLILQTATDEGLGACFFGVPREGVSALRASFGIPEEFAPIGAITLGHPAPARPSGSTTRRPRRPLAEVAHDGRWGRPLG
jgi:nitroreductase